MVKANFREQPPIGLQSHLLFWPYGRGLERPSLNTGFKRYHAKGINELLLTECLVLWRGRIYSFHENVGPEIPKGAVCCSRYLGTLEQRSWTQWVFTCSNDQKIDMLCCGNCVWVRQAVIYLIVKFYFFISLGNFYFGYVIIMCSKTE